MKTGIGEDGMTPATTSSDRSDGSDRSIDHGGDAEHGSTVQQVGPPSTRHPFRWEVTGASGPPGSGSAMSREWDEDLLTVLGVGADVGAALLSTLKA